MFIVPRLTSRSSVALSVSIGYARMGGGRGMAMRSRSPDDDARSRPVSLASLPGRTIIRGLTGTLAKPGRIPRSSFLQIVTAAPRSARDQAVCLINKDSRQVEGEQSCSSVS